MHIIADANIALLEETFGQHGPLYPLEGREIRPEHLLHADALLVRSVTPVNAALLEGTPVRFVGTATIGTDHLDIPWLESRGIRWSSAPGCNADAAAQYTLGLISLACSRLQRDLHTQSVGIIGYGNVGSRLKRLLDALGVASVSCDPPLSHAGAPGLVDLKSALQQDIVSLHVPLTEGGPCPTAGMLGPKQLAVMRAGTLLVNTARGGVVDGPALLVELQSGRLHAALDVWPNEPAIDPALLDATLVATPHVAGYSVEGKQRGTLMIYQAFLDWLGLDQPERPPRDDHAAKLGVAAGRDPLPFVLNEVCGVARDDIAMRRGLRGARLAGAFDRLRADYPLRHDFAAWSLAGLPHDTRDLYLELGFRVE